MAWCSVVMAGFDLVFRPYHWSKTSHKGMDAARPDPAQHPTGAAHTQTSQ